MANTQALDTPKKIKIIEKEIESLSCKPTLKKLEHELHKQIQVQDKYRERQNVVAYLMKVMGDISLENIDTMGPGFDFIKNQAENKKDNIKSYRIPEKTKAFKYMQEIQRKIENEPCKVQLKIVNEIYEENFRMYQAAVKLTDKMEKKYFSKMDLLRSEIEKNKLLIDQKKEELNKLILQNDDLLMKDIYSYQVSPEIKIKNQISQGTIVMGEKSKLIIDKTIYGVKFTEKSDQKSNESKIVIEGYFE